MSRRAHLNAAIEREQAWGPKDGRHNHLYWSRDKIIRCSLPVWDWRLTACPGSVS